MGHGHHNPGESFNNPLEVIYDSLHHQHRLFTGQCHTFECLNFVQLFFLFFRFLKDGEPVLYQPAILLHGADPVYRKIRELCTLNKKCTLYR